MTQIAIAGQPLTVDRDGERLTLNVGDVIEDFGDWPEPARIAALGMERVIALPTFDVLKQAAEVYGYKLVPSKPRRDN